jgi:hypothetical protein
MKRYLLFLLLAGCEASTGTTAQPVSALHARTGICTESTLNGSFAAIAAHTALKSIQTCLHVGMPGTLNDDGKTPWIATVVTGDANAPNADVGNWQLEAFYNGAPAGKRMLTHDGVPHLNCGGTRGGSECESWSNDAVEWSRPFAPGTYVFRYTYALDTSITVVNTITVQGAGPATAGVLVGPSGTPTATAAPTAKIGVRLMPTPAALATLFQLDRPRGLTVMAIDQGGVAESAGIRKGDVILNCGDRATDAVDDLYATIAATAPGPLVCKVWSVTGSEGSKPVFAERTVTMTWSSPQ